MLKTASVAIFLMIGAISKAQIDKIKYNSIPIDFNISLPNAVYATQIAYDSTDLEKQIFHLFLPDTTGNHPLIIYIHGGGFIGGSPDQALVQPRIQEEIKTCVENGVAFASVGYRLIHTNKPDSVGVLKCLNDSKRAIQYLRYFARDLHLDPNKFALQGSSAGASTSAWLSFRDDMRNLSSKDPVQRTSTRVCATYLKSCQATMDIYRWETDVFNDFDGDGTSFTLDSIQALMGFDRISNFFGGLDSLNQVIYDTKVKDYRRNIDLLYHLTSDDPPLYLATTSQAVHPREDLFHHPLHPLVLKEAATKVGIPEVKADIRRLSENNTLGESGIEFLIRHLQSCKLAVGTESVKNLSVRIYPNPARQKVYISNSGSGLRLIEIYDYLGREVVKKNQINDHLYIADVSSLSSGVYSLLVEDRDGKFQVQKFIID